MVFWEGNFDGITEGRNDFLGKAGEFLRVGHMVRNWIDNVGDDDDCGYNANKPESYSMT